MRPRLALACLLSALAGCPLAEELLEPAVGGSGRDAAPPLRDAGLDADQSPDAGRDASQHQPDASVDASTPPLDAAVDASEPPLDAAVEGGPPPPSDAGPEPLTCDERYGAVDGYLACPTGQGVDCTFYVRLGGRTCDAVCQDNGGACLGARADSANGCDGQGAVACADGQSDGICVCTRP